MVKQAQRPVISWIDPNDPLLSELHEKHDWLFPFLEPRNSGALLLAELPRRFKPNDVASSSRLEQRAWEVAGLFHLNHGRVHEALGIFWQLYQHMLEAQVSSSYVHKGLPLVWIGDCFNRLGFPVHAKRYYMLTLCEDALYCKGDVPATMGIYFRLAWGRLSDVELRRYAGRFYELAQQFQDEAIFPEALLQRVDQRWMTEYPSASEASSYWMNPKYVAWLLEKLGDRSGQKLEQLAEYLMSCMPGCRTMRGAYAAHQRTMT